MNKNDTVPSQPSINKDLLYTFLQLYETTNQSKLPYDLEHTLNLPVHSILNSNTYNQFQFSQYPISLIKEGYTRVNEETETDINVEYIQISKLNNTQIQSKINHVLKENLFFDVDMEKDKGITLNVNEVAYIISDYLSVTELTSCYFIGAAHPWSNMSSMTFNIKTGENVKLSDIIVIDDRLKQKFLDGYLKCDRITHDECIAQGIYDDLYNNLLQFPYESFYLTESGIGFILGVSHAAGDYWTFEMPYKNAEDLVNASKY